MFAGGGQTDHLLVQRCASGAVRAPPAAGGLVRPLPRAAPPARFPGRPRSPALHPLLVGPGNVVVGLLARREGPGFSLFHRGLPQQPQLAGQQLRQAPAVEAWPARAGGRGTRASPGRCGTGSRRRIATDLLVGRVQVADGDQGGGSVFNAADGIRGGHGLAPVYQG